MKEISSTQFGGKLYPTLFFFNKYKSNIKEEKLYRSTRVYLKKGVWAYPRENWIFQMLTHIINQYTIKIDLLPKKLWVHDNLYTEVEPIKTYTKTFHSQLLTWNAFSIFMIITTSLRGIYHRQIPGASVRLKESISSYFEAYTKPHNCIRGTSYRFCSFIINEILCQK